VFDLDVIRSEVAVAKKKSGHSKKSKDWLGRTVINHYDDKGKKTGYSRSTKDFWGNPVSERFNTKGEKTGHNKRATTFWGKDVTERFNSKGEKVGYNEKGRTFWGTAVTERYNSAGEKTGHSVKASTFWGTPITQHYDDSAPSSYVLRHGGSGDSGDYSSRTEAPEPRALSSTWLWVIGIIIVVGIVLRSGVLNSFVVSPSVVSDEPPTVASNVPQPVPPYEPTELIRRDAQTGLITIDATVDGIGTTEEEWFTIVTGGMKQEISFVRNFRTSTLGTGCGLLTTNMCRSNFRGRLGPQRTWPVWLSQW
jgi:hypothetical protein